MQTKNRQSGNLWEREYDVFASHSHRDRHAVRGLIEDLEREGGPRVWLYDRVHEPGIEWRDKVLTALRNVPCCIIFIGAEVPDSEFKQEIDLVLNLRSENHELKVFTVLLPRGVMSCVPEWLRIYDIIDLGRDYRDGVERLRAAILNLRRRRKSGARDRPSAKYEAPGMLQEVEQQLEWIKKLLEQELIDKLQAEEERKALLELVRPRPVTTVR